MYKLGAAQAAPYIILFSFADYIVQLHVRS